MIKERGPGLAGGVKRFVPDLLVWLDSEPKGDSETQAGVSKLYLFIEDSFPLKSFTGPPAPALLGPHTEELLRLCSLTVTVGPLFHKGGCMSSERRSDTTGWRWQLGGGSQSQVRTRGS